jgi:G3E family GTPase
MAQAPVPATLLAGFLGSGKTTLLNRVLTARSAERIAVVVNEYGAVGIDGRLVVATAEEVVQLENGCLCCEVRGDLADALERLLAGGRRLSRGAPPARVLIEASGLASPGPIAQTLVLDPRVAGRVALAGIVTLAHAAHVADQLERHPEAAEQVAYADLLILNHADAPGADLAAAEAALHARNAAAPVLRATHADVPLERVLAPESDGAQAGWRLADLSAVATADHTHGVGTIVLRATAPLDLHRLKMWLWFLASRRTHELYRVKGLLACRDHPRSVLVQGTYQVLELGPGPEDVPAESVLVLIGRGLDEGEVRRGWEAVSGG